MSDVPDPPPSASSEVLNEQSRVLREQTDEALKKNTALTLISDELALRAKAIQTASKRNTPKG